MRNRPSAGMYGSHAPVSSLVMTFAHSGLNRSGCAECCRLPSAEIGAGRSGSAVACSVLLLAGVGMTHRMLRTEPADGIPGQLHDLLVGQVAEVRPDVFALLAKAQKILLDRVLV